jgi:hypothetical protein
MAIVSIRTRKTLLPKSGQTTSYADYDDGWYEKGSPVIPRFIDNGDGTITDRVTNLMWVKNPPIMLPGATGITTGNVALVAHGDWVTGHDYIKGDLVRDAAGLNATACNITNATAANPCVLTVDDLQGIKTGQLVLVDGIVGNMGTDVLNGNRYYVIVDHTAKTLKLFNQAMLQTGPNTTGKTYSSDGTATLLKFYICIVDHTSGTFTTDVANSKWIETIWCSTATSLTANHRTMAWLPTGGVADQIVACEALDYAGYTDWRQPNVNELHSIIDYSKTGPMIDATFFPNCYNSYYSTSTTSIVSTYYLVVDFNSGNITYSVTKVPASYTMAAMRPVRSL